MRYRHFIFDIDGTLIDTERTGVLSLIDTVRTLMGREMPYEEAYPYFGVPSSKVPGMMGYADPKGFCELWEANFVGLSHMMKPFEGVPEMLSAVKDAGYGIGCVTSRSRYEFNKDTQLAKLLPYISCSVCAEDCAGHKPDPEPLLKCISMLEGGEPRDLPGATFRYPAGTASCDLAGVASCDLAGVASECIYIGDTVSDFLCARAAGCHFALADWSSRGLQGMTPDHHLASVSEILNLLQ